jgi:hypothetical protein
LEQVTEDVQPLVAARTVDRGYGSDSQLVARAESSGPMAGADD